MIRSRFAPRRTDSPKARPSHGASQRQAARNAMAMAIFGARLWRGMTVAVAVAARRLVLCWRADGAFLFGYNSVWMSCHGRQCESERASPDETSRERRSQSRHRVRTVWRDAAIALRLAPVVAFKNAPSRRRAGW